MSWWRKSNQPSSMVPMRVQHGVVDELVKGRLELVHRAVQDPGQDVRHEAATDDRAGPGDGLGIRRPTRDPGQDDVLDGVGHGGVADRRRVDRTGGAHGGDELLDVEGHPVGAPVDLVDDLARGRQAGAQQERGHRRRAGEVEPPEADLLGQPLGQQARPPIAQRGAGSGLVEPVGGDDEEGQVRRAAGQLADGLEGQVVGPLEVLEDEDGRAADGGAQPIDQLEHEGPAVRRAGGGRRGRAARQERLAELGVGRLEAHRPEQVLEQRQRDVVVLRRVVGLDAQEAGLLGRPMDGPDEPALADARPRRPARSVRPWPWPTSASRRSIRLEDVVAADEDRALDRVERAHASAV